MVVSDEINNIMGGIESAGDVRLHNHRRKLKQRFDIVKKLGQGTYGKVQLGINKETGQEVAIKTIRKCKIETEADLIRIRREIQIMSSVRHPNIIHIYEVFENRDKMVLVMEYAAGGELYDYLSERKVLSEDEARRIFRQIATAVYYCHKHNICHRDLKLENILLDEVGNAKIADFGLSNVFSYSSMLSTFCGSPLYASPEIVKGTPYVGPEVDCWSLGVLLYTLVYGAMPFDGSNFKRLVKQISQGDYFEPKSPSPASPLIADMLNVNPARRADIQAVCSHWWINETYSELCLHVAEELASQTPVRLDLLLSLTAPAVVNSEKIVVGADQAAPNEDMPTKIEKPVRSQSLGSIPPSSILPAVPPFNLPETKEHATATADKGTKPKKKERSHSKTRRKERSRSRSRKPTSQETADKTKPKPQEEIDTENDTVKAAPLTGSETQVISKPHIEPTDHQGLPTAAATESAESEAELVKNAESKQKPMARRKSKVIEAAEKFGGVDGKGVQPSPSKKIVLANINVDGARKEFERRTSLVSDNVAPHAKKVVTAPRPSTPPPDELFPLASTVALNKLVESAFRDETVDDFKTATSAIGKAEEDEIRIAPKLMSSSSAETNASKAATLPRRRTSRAEIQLVTPQYPTDNYKTEVEHFVNKPVVNHKTEIVIPVSAPLPPKPLSKAENQSKEHIIPIQLEQDPGRKVTSTSPSWSASKSSIARTSSSSLSRQSTVDSDSGSAISAGEPIRKSPREVIIPIAVEGGGYVTPKANTVSRLNSVPDDDESNKNDGRCFTLRSTKRRQPEHSPSSQLDTADSLSSDEDDNFQLLTAENLFSTLLSRVRSLTQRLNNDEMRRSSAFPRSLFAQHGSLFDNLPSRRLSETRSFSQTENAPWRRTVVTTNNSPKRANSIKKRYSFFDEANEPKIISESGTPYETSLLPSRRANDENSCLRKTAPSIADSAPLLNGSVAVPSAATKSEARQKLNSILAKHRSGSSPAEPTKLSYSRSMPTKMRDSLRRTSSSSTTPTPAADAAALADEQLKTKPPRKSRFLRPDFYDTPREESKYVIKNETVRAFRERSLSRQRDLSRNRSTESFANGSAGGSGSGALAGDCMRSKTCSLSERLSGGDACARRDYRRSNSADTAAAATATATETKTDKCTAGGRHYDVDRTRERNIRRLSAVLPDDARSESSRATLSGSSSFGSASKRKSLILQNELENEMRKTKNMNSKLSGLMVALNESENQFEKNLGCKSYGVHQSGSVSPIVEKLKCLLEAGNTKDVETMQGNGVETKADRTALPEKKFSTVHRAAAHDSPETNVHTRRDEKPKDMPPLQASTSVASASSFENDTVSAGSLPEEEDSDSWSIPFDGDLNDNVNDRIRRRSFYSRFNIYKQKSTNNVTHPSKSSSSSSYFRSLSGDYQPKTSSRSHLK